MHIKKHNKMSIISMTITKTQKKKIDKGNIYRIKMIKNLYNYVKIFNRTK